MILDNTQDPSYAKDLVCRYKPGKIPYVTYKEEILSWDPRIGVFYDVISDSSAEMIKEKAYPLVSYVYISSPSKRVGIFVSTVVIYNIGSIVIFYLLNPQY